MRAPSYRQFFAFALISALLWQPLAYFKQGRLSTGTPVMLNDAIGASALIGVLLVGLFFALCLLSSKLGGIAELAAVVISAFIPALLMLAVSSHSPAFPVEPGYRFALGSGFWLSGVGFAMLATSGKSRGGGLLVLAASIAIVFIGGMSPNLSLYKEYLNRRATFSAEIGNHLKLAFLSAFAAILPGVLLGYLCHANRKARALVLGLINFIQVLPTLSLLGIIMLPLTSLARKFPLLQELGIRGIGFTPAFIALGLYCLFPITMNTMAGFSNIDQRTLFGASAMGMTPSQVFVKVKLPLAFPVIFSGIRTAITQNVGNATIAGLVGGGGMGTLIFLGLSQAAYDLVLLGSLPVIIMALLLDGALVAAEGGIRKAVMHLND